MNYTKNNITKEIAPAIGIGILIVLVVTLGAFFYQAMMSQSSFAVTETILDVEAQKESQQVELSPQEQLVQLEIELEGLTADVSGDDPFGLDQLDAELVEFADLDALFDLEL